MPFHAASSPPTRSCTAPALFARRCGSGEGRQQGVACAAGAWCGRGRGKPPVRCAAGVRRPCVVRAAGAGTGGAATHAQRPGSETMSCAQCCAFHNARRQPRRLSTGVCENPGSRPVAAERAEEGSGPAGISRFRENSAGARTGRKRKGRRREQPWQNSRGARRRKYARTASRQVARSTVAEQSERAARLQERQCQTKKTRT